MKLLSLFIVGLNFSRRKSDSFHPYSQVNRINRREIKLNDFDLGINRFNDVISYKIKTNPTTFIKTPSLYDIKEKQPILKARTSVVSQAQSELTSLCRQFDNLASISEEPLCEKIKKYIISYKAPNPVLERYIDHLSKRFISFFNEDKFYIITFTVFIVVISNGLENFTVGEHESDGNILSAERYKVNFSVSDVYLAALKWRGLSFRTTDHYKALDAAISLLGLQEISSDENLRKMRTKFKEGLDFFLKK